MGRMLQRMIVSAGYDTHYCSYTMWQLLCCCRHHAWTSFESWGEIYNEVFKDSANTTETNSFFSKNPILRTAAGNELSGYN